MNPCQTHILRNWALFRHMCHLDLGCRLQYRLSLWHMHVIRSKRGRRQQIGFAFFEIENGAVVFVFFAVRKLDRFLLNKLNTSLSRKRRFMVK